MSAQIPPGKSTKSWVEAALGFLYPEVCQICGDEPAGADDGYVGGRCRERAQRITPPYCGRCGLPYPGHITTQFECANCREVEFHFRMARSAVPASGVVLDVIHQYKYNGAIWFEPFLAGLLIEQSAPFFAAERWDLVVPVPLHAAKLREREFNQAECLAAALGRAVNVPLNKNLLERVEYTQSQTRLDRRKRAANVSRAFAAIPGVKLNGERIVLVDDVFTTGATTSECAKVLIAMGATEVCVWTLARGF